MIYTLKGFFHPKEGEMIRGQSILVTGGTGSFGRKFVETVLTAHPEVKRIVVFSRDEHTQVEMAYRFPPSRYPQIRYFIGDVRDKDRLSRAVEGIDIVIHAAALKHVPAAEYNPFECVKTNVLGAQNVIEACLDADVRKVIALSTDKAASPVNLYGATKLCSDKIFTAANNMKGKRDIAFSVVRYGNVMGSRGSVIPFFLARRREGAIPITDERMTRFNITLDEGVAFVLSALDLMRGAEIFVPKIPSYRILDVAEAIAPGVPREIVGIRPGEKVHEEMITESDAPVTIEYERHYVIVPSAGPVGVARYLQLYGGTPCPEGFRYSSGTNDRWLSVEDIRALVRAHVDPGFDA